MEHISLWICAFLFSASIIQCEVIYEPFVKCSEPKKLCGENICYDPTTQNCTKTKVIRCHDLCKNRCYNPNIQQCLNGTVCRKNEELCTVKYYIGSQYYSPIDQCYNPSSQACLNNSLCEHPSRSCNQQCIQNRNQICVDNTTICNATMWTATYKPNQIKLCNGVCYDSAIQQCNNGSVQCISGNCSGKCYNSSSQQCLNETICDLNNQLCTVKYNIFGSPVSSPTYECYDSSSVACLNNSICEHPYGSCNQQCLRENETCVDNTTICNITGWYYEYKPNQIKLCNGVCYDSAIKQCNNGSVQCISGNCFGTCYNSSSQQCLNGTICGKNEQLCTVTRDKYGSPLRSPKHECYNSSQVCLNDSLCDHPSQVCGQQCIRYSFQVCVDNTTICDISGSYVHYQGKEMKLCNGVCYNSTIQQCVDEYQVRCIRNPSLEECETSSSGQNQPPFILLISILTVICSILIL